MAWRKYTDEDLIEELLRVAGVLGKSYVTIAELHAHSKVCFTTFVQRFGTWKKALFVAGLETTMKTEKKYTDEFLLSELARVAEIVGKDNLTSKIFNKHSKVSCTAYAHRFGTWNKAVEKAGLLHEKTRFERSPVAQKDILKIFKRDYYTCSLCGASPANDPHVVLEVDHKKPVSKGGTNNISNLWTLCKDCNRSKSARYDTAIALHAHRHDLLLENIRREKEASSPTPLMRKFGACNLTPGVEPNI